MKCKTYVKKSAHQGITLIEALLALLILALGVLGLAVVQARMLMETRTTNARATAIRLIADLGERIRMNAAGARLQSPVSSATAVLSPYADAQATGAAGNFPAPTLAAPACDPAVAVCTPGQQAAYDVWVWRREVASALMNGRASIVQVSPQQLRVIIAWQLNENTNITLMGEHNDATTQLAAPLQITDSNTEADLCGNLPNTFICHVDFIDIPPS